MTQIGRDALISLVILARIPRVPDEVVPGLVDFQAAVPRLSPAMR
jgi:hypothetical protein